MHRNLDASPAPMADAPTVPLQAFHLVEHMCHNTHGKTRSDQRNNAGQHLHKDTKNHAATPDNLNKNGYVYARSAGTQNFYLLTHV